MLKSRAFDHENELYVVLRSQCCEIREAIIWKFSLKATREDMLVLDIGYSTSFRLGVKLPPNSLE